MITDDKILVTNDAVHPFFFSLEWATQIPGYYINHDPKFKDVVIVELPDGSVSRLFQFSSNVTWKIRVVFGLPCDVFIAELSTFAKNKLYTVLRNGEVLSSPFNGPFLFTRLDLDNLGFSKKGEKIIRENEYYVSSTMNRPFNENRKAMFIDKKYLVGKVLPREELNIFNPQQPADKDTKNKWQPQRE